MQIKRKLNKLQSQHQQPEHKRIMKCNQKSDCAKIEANVIREWQCKILYMNENNDYKLTMLGVSGTVV